MKTFDAVKLASVMAAAAAVLAACDERQCNQTDPKVRADCNRHPGGFIHGWWGGGRGASGSDASTVARGGFGGTADGAHGGFFGGMFGE
jgi:hypothetical protein